MRKEGEVLEMPIQFRVKELIAEKERLEGTRFTYEDVARLTGVNKNTIARLANPNQHQSMVALKTLERLCSFFECDLSDLMVLADGHQVA